MRMLVLIQKLDFIYPKKVLKMESKITEISPQKGPQEKFLSSSADIAIYGGSAGGGKSFALLLAPLRHIENEDFSCVVFRRGKHTGEKPWGPLGCFI